jgi:hypothetical protein
MLIQLTRQHCLLTFHIAIALLLLVIHISHSCSRFSRQVLLQLLEFTDSPVPLLLPRHDKFEIPNPELRPTEDAANL